MVKTQANQDGLDAGGYQSLWFPLLMLGAVTLIAFANAWPDALVLDDKFFAGSGRFEGIDDIKRMFTKDLWNVGESSEGLYRPLLLLSLSLETRLFGDSFAAYHLSNIFLHLLVTLLVFGLFRQIFRTNGMQSSLSDLCALLGAMVFAVHPVHTEVVNSIFNRSEMMVAIGGVGGFWWLFHHLETQTGKAWFGLAVAYLFAMFSKENAVVIPGIAVVLILLLSQGRLTARIRKCLPVFWLLIPLAFYLAMRGYALTPPGLDSVEGLQSLQDQASRSSNILLDIAAVLGESIKLFARPHPLRIFYSSPSTPMLVAFVALQLVLITASLVLLARGHSGMAAGLAFFYIAMLPASRIHGFGAVSPHVAERYLYFPSVGLTIILLFGLRAAALRFGSRLVASLGLVSLLILTALTWDRNHDWSSDTILFEAEYKNGSRSLRGLVTAHMRNKNYSRVAKICDESQDTQARDFRLVFLCAQVYANLGQVENEERALLKLTGFPSIEVKARVVLAKFHVREGRRNEAQKYFDQAIELSVDPASRAFNRAEMIVSLYPGNREKLSEAKRFYEEALRLRPAWQAANTRLTKLNKILNTGSSSEPENSLP